MTDAMFRVERRFAHPLETVWRAWTEAEALTRWFGPKGFTTFGVSLDLTPGGRFHYGMRSPAGQEMWGLWVFRSIINKEELTFLSSFADPDGNPIRHEMLPVWPLRTLSIVRFIADGDGTIVRMTGMPHEASAEEIAVYTEMHKSMNGGWNGTFDQLDAFLA